MEFQRYTLKPCSPLVSKLQSDTLTGHLFWFVREMEGEKALKELIAQFLEGDPPFVLSSAFPSGTLPFPSVPPLEREIFRRHVQENPGLFGDNRYSKGTLFKALKNFKAFRKLNYIALSLWQKQREGFSLWDVFEEYVKKGVKEVSGMGRAVKTMETPHNIIDRRTNTVADAGGLFFTRETFFPEGFSFDLYVRIRPDFESAFQGLMDYMAATGFGRDRGVGRGVFEIERDETFRPEEIESPEGNVLLNLSIFSAANMGSWRGYYRFMTKYGKVWNGFGETNPFKKPFLAFQEGSVFVKRDLNPATCVLKDIHSNGDIIQCTLPLMIPFRWEAS